MNKNTIHLQEVKERLDSLVLTFESSSGTHLKNGIELIKIFYFLVENTASQSCREVHIRKDCIAINTDRIYIFSVGTKPRDISPYHAFLNLAKNEGNGTHRYSNFHTFFEKKMT